MRSLRCIGVVVLLASLLGADDVSNINGEIEETSNNRGKIEGTKWSSVAGTVKGIKLPAGVLGWDFGKDGKLVYKVGPNNITGTYSLGAGNKVTLNLDRELGGHKQHVETVKIKGNKLTMIDSDGTTLDFNKVK